MWNFTALHDYVLRLGQLLEMGMSIIYKSIFTGKPIYGLCSNALAREGGGGRGSNGM